MKITCNKIIFVIFSIIAILWGTLTHAEIKGAKPQLDAMDAILGESYEGTPENYLAFAADQGKRIAAIADELLAQSNLTEEETIRALEKKYLAIEMASDKENSLANLKVFLDANDKREEIRHLYQRWICDKYFLNRYEDFDVSSDNKFETFREKVTFLLPLLHLYDNRKYKYVSGDNRTVYTIMNDANRLDADGKEGLVKWLYSELQPIFDVDKEILLQKKDGKSVDPEDSKYKMFGNLINITSIRKEMLQNVLGMVCRQELVGKPMEYDWINTANEPISIRNYTGKVLIIYFIEDDLSRQLIIPFLKKIYAELHSEGLEIITHGCVTPPDGIKSSIPREEVPWTEAPKDYTESEHFPFGYDSHVNEKRYGVVDCDGLFLVDRDGKVVLTHSDAHITQLFDSLKTFFPEKESFLNECRQNFNTAYEEALQKEKNQYKEEIQKAAQLQEEFPLAEQIYQFHKRIDHFNPFSEFIYNEMTENILKFKLTMINQFLACPNVVNHPEFKNFATSKYNLLVNLALTKAFNAGNKRYGLVYGTEDQEKAESETLPATPPENFFTEFQQYIDEIIERTDITPQDKEKILITHHILYKHQLDMMCYYLKQLTENQEEYAAQILDYYIKSQKIVYKTTLKKNNKRVFYSNFYSGLDEIAQVFHKIDEIRGTHLEEALRDMKIAPAFENQKENNNTEK